MGASVFMELAVSACATTFTPGPNNILLLSNTSPKTNSNPRTGQED